MKMTVRLSRAIRREIENRLADWPGHTVPAFAVFYPAADRDANPDTDLSGDEMLRVSLSGWHSVDIRVLHADVDEHTGILTGVLA